MRLRSRRLRHATSSGLLTSEEVYNAEQIGVGIIGAAT